MAIPQDQSSDAWKDWRRNKIGASDIPIIMGASPWCTPYKLWQRKLGFLPEQDETFAMARGKAMEEEAREVFCELMKKAFFPVVLDHIELEWAIASLDGYSKELGELVEIKCPGSKAHEEAKNGLVPHHYYLQMQWQMFVADCEVGHYFSYRSPDDYAIIRVDRCDTMLADDILPVAANFYLHLVTLREPERLEDEHVPIDSDEFASYAADYKVFDKEYTYWKAKRDKAKQLLVSCTDDSNCVGCGLKLTRCARDGAVDWTKLWKDLTDKFPDVSASFSPEDYRKEQIGYWKITATK